MTDREICGTCCGTGVNGHPDSGYICDECKGSGGVIMTERVEVEPETGACDCIGASGPNPECGWCGGSGDAPPRNRPFSDAVAAFLSAPQDADQLLAENERLREAVEVCLAAERRRRAKLKSGAPASEYTDARIAALEAALQHKTGE